MATFNDNFNRANGALTSPWSAVLNSGAEIIDNQLRSAAANGGPGGISAVTGNSFTDNQSAAITISLAGNESVGVGVRLDASGNGYIGMADQFDSRFRIYRNDNGTLTQIGLNFVSFVSGDKIGIEATGNSLQLFLNDVATGSAVTDATYASGVVGVYTKPGGSSNATRLDNFESEGLLAAPEFTLTTLPTFNQTTTVTTTNWGAEDPTHVDITGPSSNVLTLPLTATATANEYTFTMPTISETEGTSVSGLLTGAGTIRTYSATGDSVTNATTIALPSAWVNTVTLESGFNTEPTSQLVPAPVAGDQLSGQTEVEFLANGNINADEGVWPILHLQASTGTIYTNSIDSTQIQNVGEVVSSIRKNGRMRLTNLKMGF